MEMGPSQHSPWPSGPGKPLAQPGLGCSSRTAMSPNLGLHALFPAGVL